MSIIRKPAVYVVLKSTERESQPFVLPTSYHNYYYPNVVLPDDLDSQPNEIIIAYREKDKQNEWAEDLAMRRDQRSWLFFKRGAPTRQSTDETITPSVLNEYRITVDKVGAIVYFTTQNVNAGVRDAIDVACRAMDSIDKLKTENAQLKSKVKTLERAVYDEN